MNDTNQKQVALMCEALSNTKASSNPDQARAICEWAMTITRLKLDTRFEEEVTSIKEVLVQGFVAHWINGENTEKGDA